MSRVRYKIVTNLGFEIEKHHYNNSATCHNKPILNRNKNFKSYKTIRGWCLKKSD